MFVLGTEVPCLSMLARAPASHPFRTCRRFRNYLYSAWAHERAYKIHVSCRAGRDRVVRHAAAYP